MLEPDLLNIFTPYGRIGRARYLTTGFILIALKHNIDRLVARAYGLQWDPLNYWVFSASDFIVALSPPEAEFYIALLLVALPFIWVGITLTLRRLRDADLPLWLVIVFFVPFLNVIFFIVLAAIPSRSSADEDLGIPAQVGRFIPESTFGSAVFGILITTLIGLLEIILSANTLRNYGWGLFVGIPFFLGLNSSLISGFHRPRSVWACLLVSIISVLLVGLALFAFALEGIICLLMALPLAIPIALFGGLIGYVIQKRRTFSADSLRVVSVVFLIVPGLILFEHIFGGPPPLYEAKTSVVIKSDVHTVWRHVVTFSQLPPPTETMFKTGLAYPIRAEMCGEGVGAVRHCVFSTGAFVEPITVWDEPRLLAFDVTDQPPSMEEFSIYDNVRPPHLENYFVARRGQFELKPLPDGTTLLEGTTWYQNYYWPAPYWHVWSDYIVDGIHNRVLLHIKTLAENEPQRASATTVTKVTD